jgi:AraC-like DNA-binding protein
MADQDISADRPVHTSLTFTLLPEVALAYGPHAAGRQRIAHELLRDGREIVTFNISRSGEAIVSLIGRDPAGGNSNESGTEASASADSAPVITLALSRAAISEVAPDFAAALGKPIPARDPALRLLLRYLEALDLEDLSGRHIARAVAAHILDLVALVLGARGEHGEAPFGGAKAARLKALKADVMSMLGDCELSSELIAGRHGISSRYVRKLFEQDGTSFTSFVLGERLARVGRMLREERHAHLTISQLAHACGFNDISYFNRAFRRHFGATPSEVREKAFLSRK